MKKLNNSAAHYFKKFYEGLTKSEICELIEQDLSNHIQQGMLKPEYKADQMKYELEDLAEAEAYFSKMTIDKPQTFKLDPWGYDQTNYENMTVIGHIRGSVIVLLAHKVYSVSKAKYTKREKYTHLDDVRSTIWEPAYTSKELADQAMYNAYYGY